MLLAGSTLGETFYVSTNGNDAWTGRLVKPNAERTDGPLATLTGARDMIRKLKSRVSLTEPVRVIVSDGHYQLQRPLVIEAQDGGTKKFPVIYEAAKNARPVFSGGRVITGWEEGLNGIWKVEPGVDWALLGRQRVPERVWGSTPPFSVT